MNEETILCQENLNLAKGSNMEVLRVKAADRPLQIIFKGEAIEVIEKLQKKSGAISKTQVIKDALALYEILDGIAKEGKLVVAAKDSSEKKLITLPQRIMISPV